MKTEGKFLESIVFILYEYDILQKFTIPVIYDNWSDIIYWEVFVNDGS